MAIAGVSDVYSASSDVFKAFLGIDISPIQVYRVSNQLGHQIDLDLRKDIAQPPPAPGEVIYACMDGSMILTDTGWQEVKVGRVFSSFNRSEAGAKGDTASRFALTKSTYCAHLGTCEDFIPLFEASLGTYRACPEQLAFINDGAPWIQQYVESKSPAATHILDYYHALEHLAEFSRVHFKAAKSSAQWLDKQAGLLLSDGVDLVLTNLAELNRLSADATECRRRLVGYYSRNRHRMQYGTFRNRGLQIGSGAMEAAHRTVVQCRMKRSGQRWSDEGAQAMLNLRVAYKSDRWELVRNCLSKR